MKERKFDKIKFDIMLEITKSLAEKRFRDDEDESLLELSLDISEEVTRLEKLTLLQYVARLLIVNDGNFQVVVHLNETPAMVRDYVTYCKVSPSKTCVGIHSLHRVTERNHAAVEELRQDLKDEIELNWEEKQTGRYLYLAW